MKPLGGVHVLFPPVCHKNMFDDTLLKIYNWLTWNLRIRNTHTHTHPHPHTHTHTHTHTHIYIYIYIYIYKYILDEKVVRPTGILLLCKFLGWFSKSNWLNFIYRIRTCVNKQTQIITNLKGHPMKIKTVKKSTRANKSHGYFKTHSPSNLIKSNLNRCSDNTGCFVGCFVIRRINAELSYSDKFQTIQFSKSIFLFTLLNVKTVLFETIEFNISTQFSSI